MNGVAPERRFFGLAQLVLALKAVHASGRIHNLLLAGIEGVAF